MSEKQIIPLDSSDTVVSNAETGMDGMSLGPVLEKIPALGRDAIEGKLNSEPYENPVVFNHKGIEKVGQAMYRTESGTFIVWPPIPPRQPGQITGDLGMVPIKPYRIQAEDLRPLDPSIDMPATHYQELPPVTHTPVSR